MRMIQSHPDLACVSAAVSAETRIDIWDSIRIQVSTDSDDLQQIRAGLRASNHNECPDPVLYVSNGDTELGRVGLRGMYCTSPLALACANKLILTDCSAGLLHSLLRLRPTKNFENPPLMAYINELSNPSDRFDRCSGMHIVHKVTGRNNVQRARLIPARNIVQLCPLAPVIQGKADRTVKSTTSLAHYQSFYVNKYHDVEEHQFMHVIQ